MIQWFYHFEFSYPWFLFWWRHDKHQVLQGWKFAAKRQQKPKTIDSVISKNLVFEAYIFKDLILLQTLSAYERCLLTMSCFDIFLTEMYMNSLRKKTTLKVGLYHSLLEWFHPFYVADKASGFRNSTFPLVSFLEISGKSQGILFSLQNSGNV